MLADVFPDYDPLKQMVMRALNKDLPEELRHAADKEVAKYIYPTLKAVEVTGQDGGAVQQRVRVILIDDPGAEVFGLTSADGVASAAAASSPESLDEPPSSKAAPREGALRPPRRRRKAVVDLGVPTPAEAPSQPQRRRRRAV